MSHAEICPVCRGRGLIPPRKTGNYPPDYEETCNGCMGRGWVEITDWPQLVWPQPSWIPTK